MRYFQEVNLNENHNIKKINVNFGPEKLTVNNCVKTRLRIVLNAAVDQQLMIKEHNALSAAKAELTVAIHIQTTPLCAPR